LAHQYQSMSYLTNDDIQTIDRLIRELGFESKSIQTQETLSRYTFIDSILKECVSEPSEPMKETPTRKIDKVLTHKVWGYVCFFLILLFIFQSIFTWAEYPMALIEHFFASLEGFGHRYLPDGAFTDLLLNGVLA